MFPDLLLPGPTLALGGIDGGEFIDSQVNHLREIQVDTGTFHIRVP